jgi:hypothetical protein
MVQSDPQLRWCVRRRADLGAAGSEGAARRHVATVRELPSVSHAVYPLLASFVEPPFAWEVNLAYMVEHLIGPPVGPQAGEDIVLNFPGPLELKRGAVEQTGRRGGGRLPAFKAIPMQPIDGAAEPVISFEILWTKGATAFAKHPRKAAAEDRRLAWRS